MRSKAPLVLMEQLIMVLVFAIAAALCLRMFVGSDNLSKDYAMTDRAVLEAQTAAERLKHDKDAYFADAGAVYSGGTWTIGFDENWKPAAENTAYYLCITCKTPVIPYLLQADISVRTAGGEELFALPVAWQADREVTGFG